MTLAQPGTLPCFGLISFLVSTLSTGWRST